MNVILNIDGREIKRIEENDLDKAMAKANELCDTYRTVSINKNGGDAQVFVDGVPSKMNDR